jgi:SSS family solute:Na+ symporter
MQQLQTLDYIVFFFYFIVVSGYGYWIYQRKKTTTESTKDFFLAEGSLTWWAIGASLIASNISAEQFIGMSGNGFFDGSGNFDLRMDGSRDAYYRSGFLHANLS